jgi:hypothetical protein
MHKRWRRVIDNRFDHEGWATRHPQGWKREVRNEPTRPLTETIHRTKEQKG